MSGTTPKRGIKDERSADRITEEHLNTMNVEVKQEGGYWSVYVNGRRMVDRESFAVADRVREALERPDLSEAGEAAQSIRDWVENAR